MKTAFQWISATVMIAVLAFATPGIALEKTSALAIDKDVQQDGWRGGATTCSVVYYNICTGWIWIWSGWSPGDQFGVSFDSCCAQNTTALNDMFALFTTGAPSGYGFTGNFHVYDADLNGCPTGAPVATQAHLPASGWNQVSWSGTVVPDASFAIVYENSDATIPNPMAIATDHPAVGPTGPAACGTCFPSNRENRSFYYGTAASPLCPGSALNDGVCDAQLVIDVGLSCTTSVDSQTWGTIKNLYR
ncbi:MAG: hypothetical protein KC591_00305 [Gemmatimonadetes bacterium]|nr:hypothetical protein [Gemmatimonadota bacterium]